ncbi:redoxin domain-containing protein [Crocinitomix catalasitica]|uniref:redoxin domain-containing protein n=1 Tax=Crocinitomix catalasitica TaxID=184607 RepID=UPI00048898F7|nr:redoxin domain-containing protein [Crocinitomix catalasitica]
MKRIIKVRDFAPAIQTKDLWGSLVNIPAPGKWIYLSFHRFAACPFCNLRTNELIQNYALFQNHNVEIVSLWPSDKENLLRFVGKEKPPFLMVSDKGKSIYKAYGVTESSFTGMIKLLLYPLLIVKALKFKPKKVIIDTDPNLMPANFLIGPDGVIRMAHYGKHFGDHPKIESILSKIKQLNNNIYENILDTTFNDHVILPDCSE